MCTAGHPTYRLGCDMCVGWALCIRRATQHDRDLVDFNYANTYLTLVKHGIMEEEDVCNAAILLVMISANK
jgi:hypothetical protein